MLSYNVVVPAWIAHTLSCKPMPSTFIRHFSPYNCWHRMRHFECWNIYLLHNIISCYFIFFDSPSVSACWVCVRACLRWHHDIVVVQALPSIPCTQLRQEVHNKQNNIHHMLYLLSHCQPNITHPHVAPIILCPQGAYLRGQPPGGHHNIKTCPSMQSN